VVAVGIERCRLIQELQRGRMHKTRGVIGDGGQEEMNWREKGKNTNWLGQSL
jgi:hypothetical protein